MIVYVLGFIIFALILGIKFLIDKLHETKSSKENEIYLLKDKLNETKSIERGLWVFFTKDQFISLPFSDPIIDDAQRKYIDYHRDEINEFDRIMRKYKGTPREIRYPFMKNARKVAEQMLENAKLKQKHSKKRFPTHDRR